MKQQFLNKKAAAHAGVKPGVYRIGGPEERPSPIPKVVRTDPDKIKFTWKIAHARARDNMHPEIHCLTSAHNPFLPKYTVYTVFHYCGEEGWRWHTSFSYDPMDKEATVVLHSKSTSVEAAKKIAEFDIIAHLKKRRR